MIRFEPSHKETASSAPHTCIRSLEERMADDLRELAFSDQNTDDKAMLLRGWTAATIKRLAPRAVEIARRQSVRQVAQ